MEAGAGQIVGHVGRSSRLTEDGSWRIITGKTGLTHTRAVKDHCQHFSLVYSFSSSLPPHPQYGLPSKWGKGGSSRGGRWRCFWETYPLSMTRAATSSVGRSVLASVLSEWMLLSATTQGWVELTFHCEGWEELSVDRRFRVGVRGRWKYKRRYSYSVDVSGGVENRVINKG